LFRDILQMVKLRLTLTVVSSAVFGYLIGIRVFDHLPFDWIVLAGVSVGGFFTVAASNGLNQLIEKDRDALMDRTMKRPLVRGSMSEQQARLFCLLSGIAGFAILWFACNPLSAWLGLASLVLYSFIYTPLKRSTPLAVLIGAFPGALPPLIGWTAATSEIGDGGLALFGIQFFWQFPHFWALAWMLHDDYQKAGYWLLPTPQGRSREGALQITVYTIATVIMSLTPVWLGMSSQYALIPIGIIGALFLMHAFKLQRSLEIQDARKLFFISLAYNPLVFISIMLL
jgi:heme o synthase